MDYVRKTRVIANSYYNMGLERARLRDLSGAAECLKKSLHFNKYQTDARNLLGLIYYEVGEVGDALVQWVISMNLQPQENRADYYLGEIQRKKGSLDTERHMIRRFNQALVYAQNGSEDLAILQLVKVVEAKPNYVKAQLLLAILCIAREDYQKAGKSVYKVLQIDRNHPKALWYKSIVKANTGSRTEREPEKRKLKNVLSHRQMEDDDVIIPNTYKENTGISTVLHIIIGLVLGIMAFYFLILPARTRDLNSIHDNNLKSYMQKLNNANQQYDILKADYDELDAHTKEIQARLDELTTGNTSVIAQYQGLIWILQDYRSGDLVAAAKAFAGAGFDLIEDENIQAIVENIRQDMTANIYQSLVDRGLQLWNAGNKTEAMDYFQASLTIKPDNPEALFYVGRLYQDAGDTDNANSMFDKVVNEFPDSEYVDRAKNARGY